MIGQGKYRPLAVSHNRSEALPDLQRELTQGYERRFLKRAKGRYGALWFGRALLGCWANLASDISRSGCLYPTERWLIRQGVG